MLTTLKTMENGTDVDGKVPTSLSPSRCCWLQGSDQIDLESQPKTIVLEEEFELKKLYCRMVSSVDEGPFHETQYQKHKQDLSYKAQFHGDIFLEFFAYYFSFFLVLGPLTFIFLIYNRPLMRNLGFWSWRIDVIFQYALWLGNIFCTLIYFFTNNILSSLEIGILWFAVVFRCIIVATKFATMNIERIQIYKRQLLSSHTIRFDTVLFDWAEQSTKIQMLEMIRAAKRHEFDTRELYIEFIVPPMESTLNKINAIKIDHLPKEKEISGFKLLSYYINEYQSQCRRQHVTLNSFIHALAIILPSKILRIRYYSDDPLQIIVLVITSCFQVLSLNCIFMYLNIGIEDFTRKLFLLEQCQYLISTSRVKCQENKLAPSINFHNQNTLESWSMLRSIIFDYGTNYQIRTQIQNSFVVAVCIFSIVCALQMILGYFLLDLEFLIPLSILSCLFIKYIGEYLYRASQINDYFEIFNNQLENLKFTYLDIKRRKDYFFKDKNIPQNFIHKIFTDQLIEQYDEDLPMISYAIESTIENLEDCILQNSYDNRNFPIKLLGITITLDLLQNLTMGLFTIVSFVIQQRLSTQ